MANKNDEIASLKKEVNLTNTYWKLVELNGQPIASGAIDSKEVYIKFTADGNKVEGFGGCNGFGGAYATRNDFNMSITNIISTMIACPQLEVENNLFTVLKTVDNYYLKGDTLSMSKARMATMVRFVAKK